MANEVNVKVKVKDTNGNPRRDLPVLLMNPDSENNKTNPQPSIVLASGDTGIDGYALFVGVTGGTYAIQVVDTVNTGTAFLYNYEVRNSFVTNPDQLPFESRFSVRSAESVASPGILTHNKAMAPTGTFTGGSEKRTQYDTAGPQLYQNEFGTIFTGTSTLAGKQSGNSYYHLNQNETFTQFVDIAVGI